MPGVPLASQSDGRLALHMRHAPQRSPGPPTTMSPGCHRVTPSPTAATVPIHSWPCQLPGTPQPSSTMCRSLPQMPHSSTATSTSSEPTSGTGTCSTATSPAAL